jgi:hypothetical protein
MLRSSSVASTGGHPSARSRRALGGLAAVAVLALLLAACSSSTNAPSTTTNVSIPSGWKTHTYGKMAIAVPSNWAVKRGTNCPNAPAPGTLLLGLPAVLSYCAAFQYPKSVVTVSQLSSETSTTNVPAGQKPVTINGIPVYLGFGSTTMLQWTVPSLDVQITGTGPNSNRVMHTLHKASRHTGSAGRAGSTHASTTSSVGPTAAPATNSTLLIPSPAPACPPGCSHPSNFDAITVLASSATMVAIITVKNLRDNGAAGTISVDRVLQGNPNGNVYPPTPQDLFRIVFLANAGPGRSYLVFTSFNRGGPCPSALFAYDPSTQVATFVHQWSDLGPNDQIPLPGRITTIPATIDLVTLRRRLYPTGGVTYPVATDGSICPRP